MGAVGIADVVGDDVGFVVYFRVGFGVGLSCLAEGAVLGLSEGASFGVDGEEDGFSDDVGEKEIDGDGEDDGLANPNRRPVSEFSSSTKTSASMLDKHAKRKIAQHKANLLVA
mmetsp:Transcript_13480/g.17031  ORF Transcript_13480/g.17031 Transcript_13480/m.17031 type:complete len:113 (-) Transcript_13480:121-459(-)